MTWSKAIDTVWDAIDMAMMVGGIAKGLFNFGKKLMPAGRNLFGSIRTRIFGVPASGVSTGGIAMDLQFFGADDVGRYADDLAEAGVRNGTPSMRGGNILDGVCFIAGTLISTPVYNF